jgi:Tfp pilus assembly protein PilZ
MFALVLAKSRDFGDSRFQYLDGCSLLKTQGGVQPEEVWPIVIGDDVAFLVGSVTDVAVRVTVSPAVAGLVYVMGTELAEAGVGVKVPQGEVAQLAAQVTPRLLLSLVTVAATPHCSVVVMDVGGVKPGVKATVMAGGVELCAPQAERKAMALIRTRMGSKSKTDFDIG